VTVFTKRVSGRGYATVLFIRHVSTVIVSITDPSCWNTDTVSALELIWRTRSSCIQQTQSHQVEIGIEHKRSSMQSDRVRIVLISEFSVDC